MKTLLICKSESIPHIPVRDSKFNRNPELFNKTNPFSITSESKDHVCTSLPSLEGAEATAKSIIKYSSEYDSYRIEEDSDEKEASLLSVAEAVYMYRYLQKHSAWLIDSGNRDAADLEEEIAHYKTFLDQNGVDVFNFPRVSKEEYENLQSMGGGQ